MSELKAYWIPTRSGNSCHCYLKSEADKVIAELEKEIDELQDKVTDLLLRDRNMALNFNNAVDALVHNKYKRCVAMKQCCYDRWIRAYHSNELGKTRFYVRWQKRWEALAEKFKEAK